MGLTGRTELSAQVPPAPHSPIELTKYDVNRNGTLDADERKVLETDRRLAGGSSTEPKNEEAPIQLSPFEVISSNRGYQATTTMSGTRLNANLEDLGAAISVVTAEQMADLAMLDINDVFSYEVSTEGMGNYTDVEVDRRGMVVDNAQDDPAGATRVRGMGSASVTLNNFATTRRVPVDPLDIEALEINRGPNSSIFGIGGGAGSVNLIGTTAKLAREITRASVRFDDLGGWRTSLDVSRPLIRNKLALRFSGALQHDAFSQKPSGFDTKRFNVMLRAQPFKYTSLQASFRTYRGEGSRPNTGTPRDSITYWKSVGSPTWDPVTSTVTVAGVSRFMGGTDPLGLGHTGSTAGQPPNLYVGPGGVELWMIGRMPAAGATNGPNNQAGQQRLLEALPEPLSNDRPLFSTLPGVSDKSIYDWTSINLAAPNSIVDKVDTTIVQLEQFLLDKGGHQIALQAALYREDASQNNYNTVNQQAGTGNSGYLNLDVNERLLDGRSNPYFLAPYMGVIEGRFRRRPHLRETYRGQLAYVGDFTNQSGWSKWIGRHQLLGYYEYRADQLYNYTYRLANVSAPGNSIYVTPGESRGQGATTSGLRTYNHYYVGDGQGLNVDYAPGRVDPGQYDFEWFNPRTGSWVTDRADLGAAGWSPGAGGGSRNLIKSQGGVLQSALLRNRVVLTLGKRRDENWNKALNAPVLDAAAIGYDTEASERVREQIDWFSKSGDTLTKGIVVKPLRWLNLHYNESDTFQPLAPEFNLAFEVLGSPTTEGKDYGFSLNLFKGKLVIRANRYNVVAKNSRDGENGIIAGRFLRIDGLYTNNNDTNNLRRNVTAWVTAANPAWTEAQVLTETYRQMQYDADQIDTLETYRITETSDLRSKGDEIEIFYNPDSHWTTKINIARNNAFNERISAGTAAFIAKRLPVWTSIIDPRTNQPWWTTRYGNRVSKEIFENNLAIVKLAQATEGLRRPQIREWRVNLSTRYRLEGITEHKHLKRMSVGGSVRWEDKGAIGYYGIPVNGDITAATEFDATRPVWSPANTYVDTFVSYNVRMFSDKVRARFQLNARNLHESGGLQAVGAFPDGSPHTYRILNPRTFIFSATFDL